MSVFHTIWTVLNNYRPVSKLSYWFKTVKRAVTVRLNKCLLDNNLIAQSAYITGQSTETALIRVKNNIMMSSDQSKPVILVKLP